MEAENNIKLSVVHSRSTAEAKTQALGGHIHVLGANISEVAEEAKSGALRILGVMSPQRSKFLPKDPTFAEQGFKQLWSVSRGIAAPAGLDKVAAKAATIRGAGEGAGLAPSTGPRPKASACSLEVIKGAAYVKFLKDNETSTKKLMGW